MTIRDNKFLFGRRAYVKHIHIKGAVYYRWNQGNIKVQVHNNDGSEASGAAESMEGLSGAGATGPALKAVTGSGGVFTVGQASADTEATELPVRMRMQVIAVKSSLNDRSSRSCRI